MAMMTDKTALVKDFLTFFSPAEEQASLADKGYAPLPSDLQTKVKAAVSAIS